MEKSFDCVFFDGKSSRGYPARIYLQPKYLLIQYEMGTSRKRELWDVTRIHKNEFLESQGNYFLQYGNYPQQSLEFTDPELIQALKSNYPDASFHRSEYSFVLRSRKNLILGTLGAVALLLIIYFAGIPFAAERLAERLPFSFEKEVGKSLFERVVSNSEKDPAKSKYLRGFIKTLNLKGDYLQNVVVLNDRTLTNAFALPGGNIVVGSPMLRLTGSPDELAALLAHEYSHVYYRHTFRMFFRNLAGYFFIALLVNDVNSLTMLILQNADSLKTLDYNRELERQADENGLKILIDNHINPNAMVTMLSKLKRFDKAPKWKILEFFNTHPLIDTRINYLKKDIKKEHYTVQENRKREAYWRLLRYGG